MEEARVIFFHIAKRFGFLGIENEPDLFFHYNDGEYFIDGENEPRFSGITELKNIGRFFGLSLSWPKRGDVILFTRKAASQGPIASPWGFKSDYESIVKKIKSRTTYRLLVMQPLPEAELKPPDVLWEGHYLLDPKFEELKLEGDGESLDFLRKEHSSLKWWERWDDSEEEWLPCSVPIFHDIGSFELSYH